MFVRPLSLGHAVPRMQFDALVHSVFASAANLQLDDSRQLLTLLAATGDDLAQGIRLAPAASALFPALQPAMKAACRDGVLRFAGAPFAIDLQQAACWDGGLPMLQARMDEAPTRAAWTRAWQAVNERQAALASELRASNLLSETPGEQPAWVERAGSGMRHLVRSAWRCDGTSVVGLEELVGLGPGLTPSGDDLLAGYLLGLRYAAQGRQERLGFLDALANTVPCMLHRTGDISATYLFHAARGEPSRALFELASAVCSPADERTVLECAQAAMSAGHTSGMDAVTGLLIGLAAWDAPELAGLRGPHDQPAR